MSARIKHVFLTRFNVPSPGRELHLRSQPGWLADRFRLFRDYCLPSVAQQTETDFDWVIFFDRETPAEFKQAIVDLQKVFPFHAEFTDLFMMPEIIPAVLPRYADCDWLLTTRLDSDDILAVDHVARLREAARAGTAQVFNFPNGAILSAAGAAPRLYRIVDRKIPSPRSWSRWRSMPGPFGARFTSTSPDWRRSDSSKGVRHGCRWSTAATYPTGSRGRGFASSPWLTCSRRFRHFATPTVKATLESPPRTISLRRGVRRAASVVTSSLA